MLSRLSRLAVLPSRSQARVVEVSRSISTLMASSSGNGSANAKDCRTNSPSSLLLRYGGCSNLNMQKQQAVAFSTNTRRRRRRGGGGGGGGATSQNPMDEDTSDDKPSASSHGNLSNTQFLSIANSLLDKVESAVTKLKDSNDGLEVTRYSPSTGPSQQYNSEDDDEEDDDPRNQEHGGQLSIQVQSSGDFFWGGGTYWLTIHSDSRTANLQSPLSGTFTYRYNASSDEWVGTDDGHSLVGMLTRDWIRQCRGVPDF